MNSLTQTFSEEQQRRITDGLFVLRWSSEHNDNIESDLKMVRVGLLHRSSRFKSDKRTRLDAVLRDLEALKLIAMSAVNSNNGRPIHAFIPLETPADDVVTRIYRELFENETVTEPVIETVTDDKITDTPEPKKQIGIRFLCDCSVFYDGTNAEL